jgi:hypothetical protein
MKKNLLCFLAFLNTLQSCSDNNLESLPIVVNYQSIYEPIGGDVGIFNKTATVVKHLMNKL